MDPVSIGLGAVSGLSQLSGILGASAAQKRAEQARQQALAQMAQSIDSRYQNQLAMNQHGLLGAAGMAGTALQNYGSNLGAAGANAGIYNSTANAGLLAAGMRNTQNALAGSAYQNNMSAQQAYDSGQQYLANARMGLANQQYGEASGQLAGARSGMNSFLGSLGQYALGNSGARNTQMSLPRAAGGYGYVGTGEAPNIAGPPAPNFAESMAGGIPGDYGGEFGKPMIPPMPQMPRFY